MSLRIRLRRIGKNPKKRPYFRITVIDESRSRNGRSVEEIGFYDPTKNPPFVNINKERYDFWLGRGAIPSETMKSLVKKSKKGAKNAAGTGS